MNLKIKLDLENLPPSRKKLLIILPPLLIVVLSFVFLILPDFEERQKLSTLMESQKNEISTAQQKTATLAKLISENERLKKRLAELQLQLPEEREVSGLLKQTSEEGVKSGLDVVLWKPKGKSVHSSKEVYEIPVEVEMRGNYHNFGQFFSNITKLDRIVNISNINMKPSDKKTQKGAVTLNVSFTAMTYSLIPEAEKKEMEKAAKAKDKAKEVKK
jgi:type IV pilus assembly protein PilO